MEFAQLPDESYFAMLATAPELDISHLIISRAVHFWKFTPGKDHPITLHDGDEDIIFGEKSWNFFARKVDASKDKKLKEFLDQHRNNFPYMDQVQTLKK